jgi:hypothetical protein
MLRIIIFSKRCCSIATKVATSKAFRGLHRGRLLAPFLPVGIGRFSNRPFWVKRFHAIHRCNVDVTRGLALLFGIGTRALPPWDSRTGRNNLSGGLTVKRQVQATERTHLIHRPARDIIPPQGGARVSSYKI